MPHGLSDVRVRVSTKMKVSNISRHNFGRAEVRLGLADYIPHAPRGLRPVEIVAGLARDELERLVGVQLVPA
jgi:hypothetical protein